MKNRKTSKLESITVLLFAVVLSYIFTAMSVWTVDSRFLTISRFTRHYGHENLLAGTGFAPEQYRFGGYYLVEHFFKHIPLRWYDNYNANLSNLLTSEEAWTKEIRKNLVQFFPPEDREKLIEEIDKGIETALENFFPENLMVRKLLRAAIEGFGWRDYVNELESTVVLLGGLIPANVRTFLEEDSEETKLLNGYFTSRFFFMSLLLCLIYLFCNCFLGPFPSLFATTLFAAMIPLAAQDFLQAETLFSLVVFAGALIAVFKKKDTILLLLVLLGCTARTDHAFFAAAIYFLFYGFDALKARDWKGVSWATLLLAIPVGATLLLTRVLYPGAEYYVDLWQWEYNLTNVWSWVFPALFLVLPLIFLARAREWEFFKKTWIWIIPFIALNFLVGKTAEVRLFLPVVLYSLPLVALGAREALTGADPSPGPD